MKIKHIMDETTTEMTLDEAFLESLSLAEGRSCEAEEHDAELLELLRKNPSFINNIKDDYKHHVLIAYGYEVKIS